MGTKRLGLPHSIGRLSLNTHFHYLVPKSRPQSKAGSSTGLAEGTYQPNCLCLLSTDDLCSATHTLVHAFKVPALLHASVGFSLATPCTFSFSEERPPPRQGSKARREVASDPRRNIRERERKFPGRRGSRARGKGCFPRATWKCWAELGC